MVPRAGGEVGREDAGQEQLSGTVRYLQTVHPGYAFSQVVLDVTVHHGRIGIFIVVAIVFTKVQPGFAFIVMSGGCSGHAIAQRAGQVLHLNGGHDVSGIRNNVAQVWREIPPPLQVIQRGVLAQAEHHLCSSIGTVTTVKAVDPAFESAPAMVRNPGIALMVGLHGPALAVDQTKP